MPRTEAEAAALIGLYRNHEATLEIALSDGQPVPKSLGRELPLSKLAPDRLTFTRPGASAPEEIVIVRDRDGEPAYLFRRGRALRNTP